MIGKGELIKIVTTNVPRATKSEVADVINNFIDTIKAALRDGDEVKIREFISMKPVRTKERPGRNPATRKPMVIPPKNSVRLRLSPAFRKSLN